MPLNVPLVSHQKQPDFSDPQYIDHGLGVLLCCITTHQGTDSHDFHLESRHADHQIFIHCNCAFSIWVSFKLGAGQVGKIELVSINVGYRTDLLQH